MRGITIAIGCAVSLLIVQAWSPTAAQSDPTAAALITNVECVPGACIVKRGGQQEPARALLVLAAGDVVEAHSGSVEIATADHRSVSLMGPGGRVVIAAPENADNVVIASWKALMRQFSDQTFSDSSASGRTLLGGRTRIARCVSRRDDGDLRLVEGERKLIVPVTNVAVPAEIRVQDRTGASIATVAVSTDSPGTTNLVEVRVMIVPGRYLLALENADGREVSRLSLDVVSRSSAPSIPHNITDGAVDEGTASLLAATWLFAADDGSWTLEAFARANEAGHGAIKAALLDNCRR